MKSLYILGVLLIISIILNILIIFNLKESKSNFNLPYIEWGEILKEKGFPHLSFEAYKNIIFSENISKEEKAKIAYLLGENYFSSELYDNAYGYFVLAKLLNKDSEFEKEIQRKIISSLELSGKSKMAEDELRESISLIREGKKKKVVAKIGREEITEDEVLKKIDELPEGLKKFYSLPENFPNFLKSYIASLLLERAALRANLKETEDFKVRLKELEKETLRNLYIEKEFKGKLKINEEEMKNYYLKNKENYKDDKGGYKEYKDVREEIYRFLLGEKQKELLNNLISRLFEAENVEIFNN